MDSGRVSMSQEWSRVVSAEVKEEYMTLQGRHQDYSPITAQKLKVISSSFELDINASKSLFIHYFFISFSFFIQLNYG